MKIVSSKPTITRKELESVLDCMIHDELATGSTVKSFEAMLSEITSIKYSLALNSLVSCYILIFKALEIQEEDEIIIPSFFDHAPVSALTLTGGKPIIIDTEENSIFPSAAKIKERISEKTKAIVLGDIAGFHIDSEEFKDINIPIIADISHSIGTEYNEKPAGSHFTFAVASFAPSMIITTGNGGAIWTNNSRYFSTMRDLRGNSTDNINFDFTLTDLQAAMGISQILKLKDFIKRRREIALKYYEAIRITTHKPFMPYSETAAYQSFPVIFDAPSDRVEKYWKKNAIEIEKLIARPNHEMLGLKGFDYPNSDRLSKKLYSIPIYPSLSKKEIERITKTLAAFI
ncbi:MAG: UDP-4-amino-4-deoxy-L-arabinose--oxoglutarate aminotransferase [Spirochaetes bacterium ADurb.Bin218]|jgi:dTDP-4-amino-4,6-dideoxygalactose transaminase|nr:DegT/DnrJ/EryC1/StrS aminotransferase family protein [Spirochaetota bacterium]OQB00338.1 MAG: UDP-4-amino-4-deoxy-L-arabinose--oxoglutarate aminotransferase [Spirochaetes bacterium ADurb.Bin218]HOQ13241.1 DegT/DnrJ/EryC1/StrS aminotransferase family protein [Spirochaetota bacterium]HOV09762.1 DegT/DnrJ/EryC1/StrS aminotransferase family protein [Spirochaetota bacterium]HPX90110.1 DegT/DnrJ/EryC1/StrS aminotransferase family protein [Spirochaetota bacterium]